MFFPPASWPHFGQVWRGLGRASTGGRAHGGRGPYNLEGKGRRDGGACAVKDQILSAIRQRLQARGLDAYIAYTPSNVFYATGFQSYFLMQWWRMQGTVLAIIPADESIEVGMMVGDFEAIPVRKISGIRDVRPFKLWVESRDASMLEEPLGGTAMEAPRPAQYDEGEQDGIVGGLLGDRVLLGARIGTDLRYMLFDSHRRFSALAPEAEWVDFTDDMY